VLNPSHPFLHTYARYPLTLVRGEGVRVQDDSGRWYLDACTGIAVMALGHAHPEVKAAVLAQLDGLWHGSNLVHMPSQQACATRLSRAFDDAAVFFTNSGVEANEAAVKLARKHHHRRGDPRSEILTATHAFHGRTLLGLAMTPKDKYRTGFGPLPPDIRSVPVEDLAAAVTERTAAVVIEPVQGEGGCRPVTQLAAIRAACDANGALLITDEIQCGLGRKGHFRTPVRSDIVALAKALGGGLPLGAAVAVNPELHDAFQPGDHGTTFGGNPVACAAADATLRIILEQDLPARCGSMGGRLRAGLEDLGLEVTGQGLMLAAHLGRPAAPLLAAMRDRGVIACPSGAEAVRFLPPFIIDEGHVDELIAATGAALADCA